LLQSPFASFSKVIQTTFLAGMQIEDAAILHAHGFVGEGGRSDGPHFLALRPRRSVNQQIVHLIEEFVKKEKKRIEQA
jgi:hypothetical protein